MNNQLTLWIENNPETGSIRPFEIYFQREGFRRRIKASYSTLARAEKKMAEMVEFYSEHFNVVTK